MAETTGESIWTRYCGGTTPGARRSRGRFLLLQFVWAICFVGATWLIKNEVVSGPVGWVVAFVPALAAVFACLGWARYHRATDELHRAIELRALALAVAAGFIAWPTYALVGRMGVATEAWADVPFLLMIGAYCFGNLFGWSRHS